MRISTYLILSLGFPALALVGCDAAPVSGGAAPWVDTYVEEGAAEGLIDTRPGNKGDGAAEAGPSDTGEADTDSAIAEEEPPVTEEEPAEEEPVEEEPAEEPLPEGDLGAWTLYVAPESDAALQAEAWRDSDPDGAELMDDLGAEPLALWVGDWTSDVEGAVDDALDEGGAQLRTLVLYNIPHRDCGSLSAGGAASAGAYAAFVAGVARGLDGRAAIVVLEPDALAVTDCLSTSELAERHEMLASAVGTLSAAGALVYLDAGQSGWVDADEMADALVASGVTGAAGFALNVAHTHTTADSVAYAEELRAILGPDAHYVVDTGRNGLGPDEESSWCNPLGRGLGERPTLDTGIIGLDALLWVKAPGESDGECNGGPSPGQWWADYALGLAERSAS